MALALHHPGPAAPARATALRAGAFSFAGETMQAAMPPGPAPMPPQWLAGLHGFSWLADLAATGEATAAQAARRWTADWLAPGAAWDPIPRRPDVTGARPFARIAPTLTPPPGPDAAPPPHPLPPTPHPHPRPPAPPP